MISIATFAKSQSSPVWLRQLCGKALASVAPDLILQRRYLDSSGLRTVGIVSTNPAKLGNPRLLARLSSFVQESAKHSTPIGRARCSGLVQSIFSSPSRRSNSHVSEVCSAAPLG